MNDDLSHSTQNVTEQFGVNGWVLFSQLFSLVIVPAALVLSIFATIYCLRHHRSDRRLPLWLLLTWLVPIVGPLCTFVALRRPHPTERTNDTTPNTAA
ncbi:PLDc N-terminal domain-containing protein [Chthoniobacter flavus]|uniref:PLDc N-terminal domain-containing protein n=1 Tax=Chthoniobacter flavus TaxID=191863 RepID=UPI000A06391D|nr:PLDc N-terminal domain-containing protein [Chthoniobacter flavus]